MENFSIHEKPCLEQTSRGFSVLYRNRFLYSKYDPQKAILSVIDSLELLDGTLILCTSPLLCYGLNELSKKLGENCFVLGIEADENLYEFSKPYFDEFRKECGKSLFITPADIKKICEIVSGEKTSGGENLPPPGTFRRVIMIDMSGGSSFNKILYAQVQAALQNVIATFWKNRITLVKFGRLFSRNLFKNLANLPKSIGLSDFIGKISAPIFVFGAGESTGATLDDIPTELLRKCFVLAVDAALPALKRRGVIPDGIIAVESQLAIEKNYIGSTKCEGVIFADMASRKQVVSHSAGGFSYFASEFSPGEFLKALKSSDFFPPFVPPLGSVGLTAVYLAILFRQNDSIPIFFSGFDFSYSLGFTHTRGAFHHTQRLINTNRLMTVENYDAALKPSARSLPGKDGGTVFTDANMLGYAGNFSEVFAGTKNLYDAGKTGINLRLPLASAQEIALYLKDCQESKGNLDLTVAEKSRTERTEKILSFLTEEEKALNRLKELLVCGKDVESCSVPLDDEISALILKRDYLFLHFPDGFCLSKKQVLEVSFLKRVRSEIDFFLKDIKNAIRFLTSDC